MSYRKYLSDYQVEDYTDEKGKVRRRAVYVGGYYTLSPAISVRDKRIVFAISILNWIALICALIPKTMAAEMMYVSLPHIFTMLPLFFMTGATFNLVSVDEQMIREKAEIITSRLPYSSLFSTILPGAAFIGLIVTAFTSWNDMLPGDIIFGALSLYSAASSAFVFSKCGKLKSNLIRS